MKKKLFLMLALALCAAMLLSSCGMFGGKEKEKELNFNSIINKDWSGYDDGDRVLAPAQKLSFGGESYRDANDRYIVTQKNDSETGKEFVYVYDSRSDLVTPLLTLENTEESVPVNENSILNDYTHTKRTVNYVHLINRYCFAVLTVSYDYIDHNSFSDYYGNYSEYTVYSDSFGVYDLPIAELLESRGQIYGLELTASYEINIYEKSDTSPVYTVSSEEAEQWVEQSRHQGDFFDNEFVHLTYNYDENDYVGYEFVFDLVIRDNAVYRVDEDGNETLVKDFGVSEIPADLQYETEEYYIWRCDRGTYNFYDKELNSLFTYVAPEYGHYYDSTKVFVLNNGSLLVQYMKPLHTDAKNYDYRTGDDNFNKYNVTTLLVDPKTGAETELDADFLIDKVEIAYNATYDGSYWNEGIENIAYVRYIDDDKMVDTSEAALDWVSMSNEGEILGSVKFDKTLREVPKVLTEGYYYSQNVCDELVIFAADGTSVGTIYSGFLYNTIDDKYIQTDDAIYDVAGRKLYDLKEKRAKDVSWLDNGTFLVNYVKDGADAFDVVVDGEVKTTYVIDGDDVTENRLERVGLFSNSMFYTVTVVGKDDNNDDIYECKYYNADGELVATFDSTLTYIGETNDRLIGYVYTQDGMLGIGSYEFYEFKFVEA